MTPSALRADPDERITVVRFAGIVSKARNAVAQYRDELGFPNPGRTARMAPATRSAF